MSATNVATISLNGKGSALVAGRGTACKKCALDRRSAAFQNRQFVHQVKHLFNAMFSNAGANWNS